MWSDTITCTSYWIDWSSSRLLTPLLCHCLFVSGTELIVPVLGRFVSVCEGFILVILIDNSGEYFRVT